MDLQIAHASIELLPRAPVRLHVGTGHRMTGISGSTWLTIDGDPRDIILEPGDTHAFDQPGHVLVQALGGNALLTAEDGVVLQSDLRRGRGGHTTGRP